MKKKHFKHVGMAILLTAGLVLMAPQLVIGNGFEGGPPEGYNFFGPAILADLFITATDPQDEACCDEDPGTYCYLKISFQNGSCRGESIENLSSEDIFYTAHDFDELLAENFEGFPLDQLLWSHLPPKCWPPQAGGGQSPFPYGNVINTITRFENSAGMISVGVVILFIVPEPN